MTSSPAKRHFQRHQALEEASKRGPAQLMDGAGIYEMHMAKLQQDRLRLKQVQSDEGKAMLKGHLLPEYADYLTGVLQADGGAQDEVVTTCMVWAIDAGAYRQAMDLAAYVIKHKLTMPDRFKRTVGCLVAEEVAEAALKALATAQSFDASVLEEAAVLTAGEDMPDEVRAKLCLAAGRLVMASGTDDAPPPLDDTARAVGYLRRAIELHSACGGKKDLERAERALKKQTEAAAQAGGSTAPVSPAGAGTPSQGGPSG